MNLAQIFSIIFMCFLILSYDSRGVSGCEKNNVLVIVMQNLLELFVDTIPSYISLSCTNYSKNCAITFLIKWETRYKKYDKVF
jgi:hypothetical protein